MKYGGLRGMAGRADAAFCSYRGSKIDDAFKPGAGYRLAAAKCYAARRHSRVNPLGARYRPRQSTSWKAACMRLLAVKSCRPAISAMRAALLSRKSRNIARCGDHEARLEAEVASCNARAEEAISPPCKPQRVNSARACLIEAAAVGAGEG